MNAIIQCSQLNAIEQNHQHLCDWPVDSSIVYLFESIDMRVCVMELLRVCHAAQNSVTHSSQCAFHSTGASTRSSG